MTERALATTYADYGPEDETHDLLHLVADTESPVGRDAVAAFLAACQADAKANDGRVCVSRVSDMLPEDITSTERYSSLWQAHTGNGRPMQRVKDSLGRTVYDTREGSRSHNNGKPTIARRWVGEQS